MNRIAFKAGKIPESSLVNPWTGLAFLLETLAACCTPSITNHQHNIASEVPISTMFEEFALIAFISFEARQTLRCLECAQLRLVD